MKYLTLLFFCFSLLAQDELTKKIAPLYRDGDYFQVLEELNSFEKEKKHLDLVYYWMALAHSKLQEYSEAAIYFKKAILLNDSPKDIYYHYGQILFGLDDIRAARSAFGKSVGRGENGAQSNYYVGYISQRLEDWERAIEAYQNIIESDGAEKDLIQLAYYQIGLCKLGRAKQTSRTLFRKVRDEVIPMLELAYDEDRISNISNEIRRSILKLRDQYNLPEKTKEKKHSIRFSQKIKFDTNVTLTAGDLSNVPPTNRESLISSSDLMLKKKVRFLRKTRTTFELSGQYDYHFKRDVSEIYQYDNMAFSGAIRNEWRHQVNKKKFTMLLDLEYDREYQDYQQEKKLPLYSREFAVSLGEKFRLFDIGSTMIKFKRKQYYGYTETLNYASNIFSFFQFVKLRRGDMLLFIFNYDDNNAEIATDSSTNYYFRGDYLVSQFLGIVDLRIGSGIGFLDTELQSDTRGMEIMLTPAIELTFNLSSGVSMAFMYEYTKNISKDKSLYHYSKQVATLDLMVHF